MLSVFLAASIFTFYEGDNWNIIKHVEDSKSVCMIVSADESVGVDVENEIASVYVNKEILPIDIENVNVEIQFNDAVYEMFVEKMEFSYVLTTTDVEAFITSIKTNNEFNIAFEDITITYHNTNEIGSLFPLIGTCE